MSAASTALITAILAGDDARQEYRLTVAGKPMIVTPGLTADGRIDVEGLREALETDALAGGVDTPG